MALKQGQDHQTWYELVDPKQGCNNARFEKLDLTSVQGNASNKVFVCQLTDCSQVMEC